MRKIIYILSQVLTSTLSSFSQILIHSRFKNYPTRTDIIGLASPQQLKSLNRDVKKSLHNTRNIWTDPRATSASESRFLRRLYQLPRNQNFLYLLQIPTHHPITKRHVTLTTIFPNSIHVARKFQTVLSSAERCGTQTLLTAVYKRLI